MSGAEGLEIKKPQCWTIAFQLMVSVNFVLALFTVFILVYEYRFQMSEGLEDKRNALELQAKTLLPSILQLAHHGRDEIQEYIDSVCGRIEDAQSPRHHIVVEWSGEVLQATAHHRDTAKMLDAVKQAAQSSERRVRLNNTELLVGVHSDNGSSVYVSETIDKVRWSVTAATLRRLGGFVGLATLATIIINSALWRVVTRPLHELVATVQEIGKGKLGKQTEGGFRSAEFNYLAEELNTMSESLATKDRERKVQMARAHDIQQNLLPSDVQIPGLEIAHWFRPAEEVGGDYFDFLPLRDGRWILCLADVTGHGVPAAMTAAMLKAFLLQAADELSSPAKILQFINQRLVSLSPQSGFVTMIILRVEPACNCLHVASAGHEPAWFVTSQGKQQELSATGIPLGILYDETWDELHVELVGSERLLMLTDGVSETVSETGEYFGRQRVADLLKLTAEFPVSNVLPFLDETLSTFRGKAKRYDDVTGILAEFAGPEPRTEQHIS